MDGRDKEALLAQAVSQYAPQSRRQALQEIGQLGINEVGSNVDEEILNQAAKKGRPDWAAVIAQRSKLPVELRAAGLAGAIHTSSLRDVREKSGKDDGEGAVWDAMASAMVASFRANQLCKTTGGDDNLRIGLNNENLGLVEQLEKQLGIEGDYRLDDPDLLKNLRACAGRIKKECEGDEELAELAVLAGKVERYSGWHSGYLRGAKGHEKRYLGKKLYNQTELNSMIYGRVESAKAAMEARSLGRQLVGYLGLGGNEQSGVSVESEKVGEYNPFPNADLYDDRGLPRVEELADLRLRYPQTELNGPGIPRRKEEMVERAARARAYTDVIKKLSQLKLPDDDPGIAQIDPSMAGLNRRIRENEIDSLVWTRADHLRGFEKAVRSLREGLKESGGDPNQVRLPVTESEWG
jgi:hypothetical protein